MRILVIGGGGYLGSELVNELSKDRSNQLQVVDSFTHGFPKNPKRKKNVLPPVVANIVNFRDLLRVMERFNPDVVFHLAAFNSRPESLGDFRTCAEVNYLGSANVAHAITSLRHPPSRLVFSSTISADTPQSHFGISKRAAEDLLLTTVGRVPNLNVQLNILRFSEIYGLSQVFTSTTLVHFLIDNMLLGNPIVVFGVNESLDLLHVSDAVKACKLVLSTSCDKSLLEIGSGAPVRIQDLVEKIRDLTGFNGRLRYLDSPLVPVRTEVVDPNLAKEILGFRPETDFETVLADLVKKRRKVLL